MSTRTYIAALISRWSMLSFSARASLRCSQSPFPAAHAAYLLPVVIALSFAISPFIGWAMAPMLRSRWQRQHARAA